MAQISLEKVSKIYKGGVKAVDDFNIGIENKEFMVLVGPSGCGKSTTLRMIAGLEDLTEGNIWIGAQKVNDVPAKDRDIAMVFQNYALYPHMTVYENMSFALKLRKYPKSEISRRVSEAAEILDIKKMLDRRPRELSGGERQRVALGRAIVRKPQAFLFDEPLSNLDAKLRVLMRTEIHKLRLRLQTTFVYVTHDQTEALTLGDRIVVMKDGKIQQCADPMSIYEKPANKFVASFIGTPPISLMNGRIIKKERKYYFDEGKFQVKLVEEMYKAIAPYEGKEIIFGIRGEDIYDRLFVSEASSENTVRAVCEVVEPLGSEVYLYLNSGRHSFIARVGAHNRPEVNRDLDLVFNMSKVHFFDRNTEKTIA
ncbi:MAG: glycerol-3-phosphate ABC transporter ATP-binding protein [Omnitrophica WOR_2 bacterium RIFOXYB2_FULL_38_16]|nr:MAG: glycerol-3-phosphate ABC transporter ATP-binding protein [Omnitrophica WOR_2 bacterium RIFOXYA2_FULL_38_17]OGX53364.1 MAG: glycerol-3-phosphate ABC transporter ATP-binding protein [Omnitrophica WOR_2 bacterium RIFOXYA12_FULL_38_10]OGX58316.1 MAG: glycerol-3-phosphate ABC transporter ATP-binding protein [Omnitrophica WOR_2 bacterium RIFOXYB2_FULL_38_16]OGX59701.1 MAG: glycerol-3-phosphate ABC transporter ATP-binding protein [Omnitrophica WOR_2 bacterium RIFOXYC2_FULL_38_12]HBG61363.1 gly